MALRSMPLTRLHSLALPLAALLCTSAAGAQEGPPDQPPPQPTGAAGQNAPNASQGPGVPDPSQLFGGTAGAFVGIGLGQIDGDIYASTIINTDFSIGPVGLGLALPLNLLVVNDEDKGCDHPKCSRDSKAIGGYIRRRDWDEPQDFLKFIRYVRYGHKRDPLYVLVGQHWGSSIGHGTLVNRYSNALSLDHPKLGLALDVNSTFFGVETLTDHVSDPALLAARAYLRPFGDTPFLKGWAIGATAVTDRTAPRNLLYKPAPDGSGQAIAQDDKGNPIIAFQDPVYAFGVDTEYELLSNSIISLIPYIDGNRLAGAGNGLHLGVLTNIYFPVPILEVSLQARLEYRMMQAGYIPEYFDQTYDLGRLQYAVQGPTGTAYLPKATAARNAKAAGGDLTKGYYGELTFNFGGWVQVGGLYQDYEGQDGASLGLYATLPKIEIVKISGSYLRKNFNGMGEAFKLDERSLLAASIAYRIFGPIYLRVDFTRQWALDPNSNLVQAVNHYTAGIATFIPF